MREEMWHLSAEVKRALNEGKPVVALESTIISHGMPYPHNLSTAQEVEQIIREQGAVPATIAIINHKVRIGLDAEELKFLATHKQVEKVSRRDLPYVLAMGKVGATTVSATMICAAAVGIRVFATGGIGGVHREGEQTMDISADLTELARTRVAVVSAGVKSILDIGRTLEVLETNGVPVIGYQTDAFPSFYARDSRYGVDCRVDAPEDVAQIMRAKWDLGLDGGLVVANPVPSEAALDFDKMEAIICSALKEAKQEGITGKRITPFLLDRIKMLSGGESLAANVALVKHNARVAAQIAVAYHALIS
ncbi:pseudouridine-5'-phosphate glycosidase [Laceyella tengchongensis]|uniref:pseudouridine-5'-phosphate glycosidase n=1 Tax=Laceyella tengchongensis TaxID=574699 RepID=UPI001E4B8000